MTRSPPVLHERARGLGVEKCHGERSIFTADTHEIDRLRALDLASQDLKFDDPHLIRSLGAGPHIISIDTFVAAGDPGALERALFGGEPRGQLLDGDGEHVGQLPIERDERGILADQCLDVACGLRTIEGRTRWRLRVSPGCRDHHHRQYQHLRHMTSGLRRATEFPLIIPPDLLIGVHL